MRLRSLFAAVGAAALVLAACETDDGVDLDAPDPDDETEPVDPDIDDEDDVDPEALGHPRAHVGHEHVGAPHEVVGAGSAAADLSFTPRPNDQVVIGGKTYQVVSVNTRSPFNEAAIHIVQVRGGNG
jgi:hypothetical protein